MKIVKSFNFKRAKDKKEKKTNVECKDLCKSNKEFSFKNIQKYTREITMCLFAVGLIAIGYANYQLEETVSVASIDNFSNTAILENSNVLAARDETTLGDVELVSSNAVVDNENNITKETNEENNYFTKTRLERDTMYSQMIENYEKIINNSNLGNEQKAIATQEITKISQDKNAIMIVENLIKNKGYEDVVVLKNENSVNVVVSSKNLEKEDIAKIQNIIIRELNVNISDVNISCK